MVPATTELRKSCVEYTTKLWRVSTEYELQLQLKNLWGEKKFSTNVPGFNIAYCLHVVKKTIDSTKKSTGIQKRISNLKKYSNEERYSICYYEAGTLVFLLLTIIRVFTYLYMYVYVFACTQQRYDLEQDIRQVSEKHRKNIVN